MQTTWLSQIVAGASPDERLVLATLADPLRAQAFDITPANVEQVVQKRSQLLCAVYPAFSEFCQTRLRLAPNQLLDTLWDFWLPLAMQLASSCQQLQRTLIQGILGGQGTGKTTLGAMLTLVLGHLGYRTISLSLDDLYKTYHERLALKQQDPRLIWRGPPGTHDIDLGLTVLEKLRQPVEPVAIPRFDKSAYNGAGDRAQPEIVDTVDIVLFEGWFVGVRPIDPAHFDTAPPPIETHDDREFARDMNARLHEYLPLWSQLDSLILLYPDDYRRSLAWRKDAEHDMIAVGESGMGDAEIESFVKYFWRSLHPELFIKPLLTPPTWVDLVVEINSDHSPGRVYRPGDLKERGASIEV